MSLGQGGAGYPAELDDDVPQSVAAGAVGRPRQLGARAPQGGQLLKEAFFDGLGGACFDSYGSWVSTMFVLWGVHGTKPRGEGAGSPH